MKPIHQKLNNMKPNKTSLLFLILVISIFLANVLNAQEKERLKLENPVSVEYLNKNLSKKSPKLFLKPKMTSK